MIIVFYKFTKLKLYKKLFFKKSYNNLYRYTYIWLLLCPYTIMCLITILIYLCTQQYYTIYFNNVNYISSKIIELYYVIYIYI